MAEHRRTGAPRPEGSAKEAEEARRTAEAAVAAEHRIAERFARLHSVSAALSAALTSREVLTAIAARGCALPGACGCAVALLVEGREALAVAAARGAAEQVTGGVPALPLDSDLPIAVAAREGRAVVVTAEARDLLASTFGLRGGAPHAIAALPLEAGGEVLGALGIAFDATPSLDEEERAFLDAFAHQCAQALLRARLYEAEREARLEAQRAEEAARHAMELEEQLVGIVGHDLRTPLAAIRMSVATLFRRGSMTEEQARTLARVGASAARMARIIHDLLDFTRVRKEGAIPVSRRPADLVPVVRRVIAELAAVHPEREIRLHACAAATIAADPDRIAQVVSNLVGNAIQHSPPGAGVQVTIAEHEGSVAIEVHNEGPPIRKELLGEIFEPFRRGRPGGEGGSLGLGLFIVREVVRAHGGVVAVRSSADEGTTFTVRLPPPGVAASTGRPAADR